MKKLLVVLMLFISAVCFGYKWKTPENLAIIQNANSLDDVNRAGMLVDIFNHKENVDFYTWAQDNSSVDIFTLSSTRRKNWNLEDYWNGIAHSMTYDNPYKEEVFKTADWVKARTTK